MPLHRKISDAEANYLKELMAHIAGLLDNQREDVLTTTADTHLEMSGANTRFVIEVECLGNQVMKP